MSPARSQPSPILRPATFACFAIVAQLVGSKAARDGLYLSVFDVTSLPRLTAVAAVASIVSALVCSRAMARWSPARVLPVALAVSASLYVLE